MKTYDEVMEEKAERDQNKLMKEELYFKRRARMDIMLSVVSGVAAMLMYLLLLCVDMVGFTFFFLMAPLGFLSGYATGKLNVGVVVSMVLFAAIQVGGFTFLYGTGLSRHGGGFFLILMPLLFYSICGGLMGLWNSIFDSEHRQI